MTRTLFTNIHSLIGIIDTPSKFKKGMEMNVVNSIEHAYLMIEGSKIIEYGKMENCPISADHIINCSGQIIMPTWCDSHTHIVFGGSREHEYLMRLEGQTYEAIAEAGGGILNSAQKLQSLSFEQLYESAYARLKEVMQYGTGSIEIKSGYGLTLESEIRILRVIQKLKENSLVSIKSTFLGAHAIPILFKKERNKYIDLIIDKMLPIIASEQLADYCDVFCDQGFYTVEETDKILQAASKYGLKAKIHANELAISGGVQVGIKNNAISVDHLEAIGQDEIDALKNSNTIPTVLPNVSFFLNINYAPARKMIDQGLGIAMASDYNPGSSPSGNMPLLMSIACNKMRLLPNEAFNATTINGACAMELENQYGSISVGKSANLIITNSIPSLEYMLYAFGKNHIQQVWLEGKKV